MNRTAPVDHPIHRLLAERWSPVGFSDSPVAAADLRSLFEAARWAPSAFNEQPWSYLVGVRGQGPDHGRILACLVEANQAWAASAPVLALSLMRTAFARNDKPNPGALHDLGLAAAQLTAEATARGLSVHQMGGILPEKVRQEFGLPENVVAVTGLAIGTAADPQTLPETLRARDTAPRTRKPLAEFVFGGQWGRAADLADPD